MNFHDDAGNLRKTEGNIQVSSLVAVISRGLKKLIINLFVSFTSVLGNYTEYNYKDKFRYVLCVS